MSKPILYGFAASPPVRTCLLTADAIDLDIDFREISVLQKEQLKDDYLKKNPQHTIPTLEVDGKFICDSHAIITYLIGKYGKNDSLYPKDLLERAFVDQRLHFDSGILFPRTRAMMALIVRRARSTMPTEFIEAMNEGYAFLEKFLTINEFVAGNHMTIADFSCVTTITAALALAPLSSEKYPNITKWIKKMESLPYYEKRCGKGGKMLVDFFNKTIPELKAANL